jgi:hypothetical protein
VVPDKTTPAAAVKKPAAPAAAKAAVPPSAAAEKKAETEDTGVGTAPLPAKKKVTKPKPKTAAGVMATAKPAVADDKDDPMTVYKLKKRGSET